jgi:hypothetical protein
MVAHYALVLNRKNERGLAVSRLGREAATLNQNAQKDV